MSLFHSAAFGAVYRRQLASYLANPVGYLFILAFVVATAAVPFFFAADAFFERNIADLASLEGVMPVFLTVLMPALAMGAWSTEREQGTEELLLTMPVGIADAVVAKFMAIATFATLALALCGLSTVGVLAWLGDPDPGLMFSNFFGWWLQALAVAAVALVASIQMQSQAVSFVMGLLYGAIVLALFSLLGFQEPFGRGLIALGGVLLALVVTGLGLGIGLVLLASRRWRPGALDRASVQVLSLVLAIALAVNLIRISERYGVDHDITSDGLTSLSAEAVEALADLKTPVSLTVVVSSDESLPDELTLKKKELLDKAQALARQYQSLIELRILEPEDRLDDAGAEAVDSYGIEPRSMVSKTVVGTEPVDAFLGAAVEQGTERATIPFFFNGLSVEYELVRAIRTVSSAADLKPTPAVELLVAISPGVPETFTAAQQALVAKVAELQESGREGLTVKLLQPVDESDPAWLEALQAGIARRDVQVGALAEEDSPVATETQSIPVFLGARASSAGYTRTAEWLGDEANPADRLDDIIVGARTAASKSKRVLGVLETAVTWGGGYDPARGGLIPRAPMVTEWEGQYEVRTIRPPELAEESSQEIDLLVVPLPSSLNEEGLQGLYEWIWSGRPTLLLVDPFPFDAAQRGEFLAPVEPNAPANPYGGPPPEPKGDIYRFFSGLGLTWDPAAIAWSRSNPAPSLAYLDPHFLWSMRDQGGIGDHPLMTGIDALLTMYPGVLFADLARDPAIRIEPLVTPAKGLAWGVHDYNRMLDRTGYQPRLRSRELPLSPSIEAGPMIAALVQGPLPHAYRSEPGAEGQPQPLVSPDRANLVVIADTDLASGVFLNFYRDVDGSVSESELAVLSTLRNVQFMANIVDYLAGDATMAALRGVRPSHRTLTAIEAVNRDTQNKVDRVAAKAGEEMEAANISADEAFEAQLNAIRNRTDLDQVSKENMVAAISGPAQRRLIDEKADIARTRQRQVDEARREQRATIRSFRQWVQVLAIGIPAVVLALLVALVSAAKLAREQAEVPAARARRN